MAWLSGFGNKLRSSGLRKGIPLPGSLNHRKTMLGRVQLSLASFGPSKALGPSIPATWEMAVLVRTPQGKTGKSEPLGRTIV